MKKVNDLFVPLIVALAACAPAATVTLIPPAVSLTVTQPATATPSEPVPTSNE